MSEGTLYKGISELVTCAGGKKRGAAMNRTGVIADGAFFVEGGTVREVGSRAELERKYASARQTDCGNCAVLPGFVDSHTHLTFAGERSEEFCRRIGGEDYLSIMAQGGGIVQTVEATRAASEEDLAENAGSLLRRMLAEGVTTCETKSGYGLDTETELRQLRAVRRLRDTQPVQLVPTFLGAHAVPKGQSAEDYLEFCLRESLPAAAESGLAEFADVFCERGAFSPEQSERYLRRAKELGLGLKVHADEMTPLGGAGLAVRLGAVSADHLLKVRDEDIGLLADSETVATVLPLTAFCLAEEYAPARRLIDRGAAVAVASDCNPGSCFSCSIPLLFAICCIHMKLTVDETITALTVNGAAACGRERQVGSIEPGKQADFVVLGCAKRQMLPYATGMNLVREVYLKGERVWQN